MAIVSEIWAARTLTIDSQTPTVTREFIIKGVDTEQEAYDLLLTSHSCPKEMSVTYRDEDGEAVEVTLVRIFLEVVEIATGEDESNYLWTGRVKYGLGNGAPTTGGLEITSPPEVRWSFSAYTESTIQKVSLFGQASFGNGPNFGSAINVVNREGINYTEGAPVMIPAAMLRGSKSFTASRWNSVVGRAKNALCKVNASAFSADGLAFQAGELLMVGAEARQTSDRNIEVEFQFLYSPNTSGTIDGISWTKGGWEYLWTYSVDLNTGIPVSETKGVYVASIYESTNFGDFFS